MDFAELISDFAERHGIADLAAEDNAAALDIDGIVVTLVAAGDALSISAEIGEPPAEGPHGTLRHVAAVRPRRRRTRKLGRSRPSRGGTGRARHERGVVQHGVLERAGSGGGRWHWDNGRLACWRRS